MGRVDLHCHSTYSDGTLAPAEVVRRAKAKNIEFLVLSDHDSVSGYPEAREAGEKLGVKVFCGIEINTREDGQVHVLGYGIDWRSEALARRLAEFRERRRRRASLILEKLRGAGIDIADSDLDGVSKESLGRPHVADALKRKKVVGSRQEAFKKYLTKGTPGYVEPMGPDVAEAIATIREAGGWASLAHPGTVKTPEELPRWKALGLEALEAYYPAHTGAQTDRFAALAREHGLGITGGSDFHGPGTGRDKMGAIEMPSAAIDAVLGRLAHA